jgi:hypothetical protein
MTKLRLGPVIDEKPVKLTIEMPGALMRELAEYARVHARVNSLADAMAPERLIAPMVERFMSSDREFSKLRRRG